MSLAVPDLFQLQDRVVANSHVVAGSQLEHEVELVAGLRAGKEEPLEVAAGRLGFHLAPHRDAELLHHRERGSAISAIGVVLGTRCRARARHRTPAASSAISRARVTWSGAARPLNSLIIRPMPHLMRTSFDLPP